LTDDNFWKTQYDQAWKTLNEESTRFWTRFNVSLIINAGLIIGFSTMLGFLKDSEILGIIGTVSISAMGIFFSKLWWRITTIAIQWNRHYASIIKDIEKAKKIEFKILPPEKTINGSITETSLWYPKAFLIFWIILTIAFVIYQISLILNWS